MSDLTISFGKWLHTVNLALKFNRIDNFERGNGLLYKTIFVYTEYITNFVTLIYQLNLLVFHYFSTCCNMISDTQTREKQSKTVRTIM